MPSEPTTVGRPEGLYLWLLTRVLNSWVVAPVWALVRWAARRIPRFLIPDVPEKKLHPAVAEVYQIVFVSLLVFAVSQQTPARLFGVLLALFAAYRAWEIFILAAKWILVDTLPIHGYRRSLVTLIVNLVEVSIAFTILGYEGVYPWSQVASTLGAAFKLEVPSLSAPYGVLFLVEADFLIVLFLGCVVGGIQRRVVGDRDP